MKLFGLDIKRIKKGKRSYEAADKGRRGKALQIARHTGPNSEIVSALQDLRSRSRHMVRNNGWAKRAVEAVVKHTIGEGIRPAPLGTVKENTRVKEVWKRWAETTACDFYGKNTFYGLQELAMRSIVEGGDIIVILRHTNTDKGADILPLKIQICEGDLIDHSQNGINEKGISRLGVQYSNEGELTGYWLFDSHPGDLGFYARGLKASKFYDKEDILHVFEVLRIGQARGIPFGISSFMKMSDFSDYEDAQLMKQKVAACFAAFIGGSSMPEKEEDMLEKLEPGIIERLGTDETVTFAEPPTVGDYDSYNTRILQGIAAAYGITYEMLTMDYSRVNFTSGRMAKIDVTANFRSWQYNMIVPQFCAPVWEFFMDACLIAGIFDKRIYTDWTAPRVQQLDPVKETAARIASVNAGFTTLSEIIREDGRDPEELFNEIKEERKQLKTLGISLSKVEMSVSPEDGKQESGLTEEKAKTLLGDDEQITNNKDNGKD